ncbi:MAG: DUF362 domain-containing protein [Candidatus Hermodarchaeota archaeon]
MTERSNVETQVAKVRVEQSVKDGVNSALNLLGGMGEFVQPGDMVTIKPNLNTADPYPASSDPEFIHALGETILDAGASGIKIVESSMFRLKTREVAQKTGLLEVAEKLGAEVSFLEEAQWVKQTLPKGAHMKSAYIGEAMTSCEKLVVAPCLKTHQFARFTGTMKLFVGVIKGSDRLKMHARKLEEKIADLASYFQPDLIVMDARKVFVTGGPASGQLESPGYILAGTDMVAVDVEGVRILQSYEVKNRLNMPVWEIPQIKHAVKIGLGASSDADISVISN